MAELGWIAMKVQARLLDSPSGTPITIDLAAYPSNTFESMSYYPLRCLVDGKDATAQYNGEAELVSLFVKGGPTLTVSTYDYEKAVTSPYIPDVVGVPTEQTMPDALAISTLLYLGKLQLLLRQWEHFDSELRQHSAQMPPIVRETIVVCCERLLDVAFASAAPGPAIQAWQVTEAVLRARIVLYRSATQQAQPVINDFAPDRERISQAISQALDAVTQ